MNQNKYKKGFTLLELLVDIAIIGIMSSIIIVPVSNARAKGRDAQRISDIKQIQLALELYYNTNGRYPGPTGFWTQAYTGAGTPAGAGCCYDGYRWCGYADGIDLATYLAPYINPLPKDPLGPQNNNRYFYNIDAGPQNNWQTYGLMTRLEITNNPIAVNDGGHPSFSAYFEVGPQVRYCMDTYGTAWWESEPSICAGGGN